MKLYVVIYTHRHGVDAWPRFDTEEPSVDTIIEELRKNGEWDEREEEGEGFIEVRGPYDNPHEDALKIFVNSYRESKIDRHYGMVERAVYRGARKVLGYK